MKECPRCKQKKEPFLFYKDKRRVDGLSGVCRRCHTELCQISKNKKPEKYKEYYKQYLKQYIAPYQIKNPNWSKANNKLTHAVRAGKIKKLPCEKCGNPKSVGHHPFYRYFEPLKVTWLCATHHKESHAKEKYETSNKLLFAIQNKNQQMQRIEQAISFYLNYHNVPEMAKIRITGNLLMVFKRELEIKGVS